MAIRGSSPHPAVLAQTVVNDATSHEPLIGWQELWEYRDFLFLLVRRQLEHRYRHTLIGIGWTVLNPLITMAVFGLIVPHLMSPGSLAEQTEGVPYVVFVLCGLVPWTCFSNAATRANTSLLEQAALLKNMYFPRLMLPLAQVLAALVELAIACGALALVMAVLRVPPSRHVVLLPIFLSLLAMASFGAALILSMAQVRYRDVLFLSQYGLQLGLLLTPVWFSVSALPDGLQWLMALNPMTGIVQGFRWSVLGVDAPSLGLVAVSIFTTAACLLAGLLYFRERQSIIADHV